MSLPGFPTQRPVAPWSEHHYWGIWATPADLPNVAGANAQYDDVQEGDLTYVQSTQFLYVCRNATPNAAIWVPIGAGAGTQDHQAPKYIVGNALNGDTLFVCDFLDPGNGTGIAAALAAATLVPGDVRLRPGTYDLGAAGAPTTPLAVPFRTRLVGAGGRSGLNALGDGLTVIAAPIGTLTVMQDAVDLGQESSLEDIMVTVPAGAIGGLAGDAIIRLGVNAKVLRCSVICTAPASQLNTIAMIGTPSGGLCLNNIVQDTDIVGPTALSAGSPYIGVLFGDRTGATASNNTFESDSMAINVRIRNCEIGYAILNCSGGRILGCDHLNASVSQNGGVGIFYNIFSYPGSNRARLPKVDAFHYSPDPTVGGNAAQQAIGIAWSVQLPGLIALLGEITNARIDLTPGANADATRIGIQLTGGGSVTDAQMGEISISSVTILSAGIGVDVRSQTADQTATLAGAIYDVRMSEVACHLLTTYNAVAPIGVHFEQGALVASPKVLYCGVLNSGFRDVPAGGNGILIDANVLNTIVIGNHLTPNGGTAFTDNGTASLVVNNIIV